MVDIGKWSVCGGGELEMFYVCIYIYIYITVASAKEAANMGETSIV